MIKRNSMNNNDIPCAVMADLRRYENEMEEAENQELLEFEVRLTFDTVVRAYNKQDAQERIFVCIKHCEI